MNIQNRLREIQKKNKNEMKVEKKFAKDMKKLEKVIIYSY